MLESDGATTVNDYFQSKGLPKITTPDGDLKAATIAVFGGEGFNVPTKEGSHSFIISGILGKNSEQAAPKGSAYEKELNYLMSKGFRVSSDELFLIK